MLQDVEILLITKFEVLFKLPCFFAAFVKSVKKVNHNFFHIDCNMFNNGIITITSSNMFKMTDASTNGVVFILFFESWCYRVRFINYYITVIYTEADTVLPRDAIVLKFFFYHAKIAFSSSTTFLRSQEHLQKMTSNHFTTTISIKNFQTSMVYFLYTFVIWPIRSNRIRMGLRWKKSTTLF